MSDPKAQPAQLAAIADPAVTPNQSDPGDATARNFRYQHAYGVVLLAAARRGVLPYIAIWCEHHEDFLAERKAGVFDGYQIKTSRPELGPWTMADAELVKAIGRFVDLVTAFGDRIGRLNFVSNKEFDQVSAASGDTKRRGRCPGAFLEHVNACAKPDAIASPFKDVFETLQAHSGCSAEQLFDVLRRTDLILGPSRREFDAALSHEHLACLDDCKSLNAEGLDALRDELVALVYRASSLQVTDSIRHLTPLIASQAPDPSLAAKRIVVAEVDFAASSATAPKFHFPGQPVLQLGSGLASGVLQQKLVAGGLEPEFDYMKARALAAEYNLLEDVNRRPEAYPALLRQIEERVLGELSEAHLRARQTPEPYGPVMMVGVQERLQRLASDHGPEIGHQPYECLVGVAGLLTGECRAWWSPRFPVSPEAG